MKLSQFLTFAETYNPSHFRSTPEKEDVLRYIGRLYAQHVSGADENLISEALIERERLVTTGVGKGIAFPNAKVKGIEGVCIGLYALPEDFDWQSMDKKPVYVAIPVIAPNDFIGAHLNIMARLSYILKSEINREQLKSAIDLSSGQINRKTVEAILDRFPDLT